VPAVVVAVVTGRSSLESSVVSTDLGDYAKVIAVGLKVVVIVILFQDRTSLLLQENCMCLLSTLCKTAAKL